MPTGNFDVFEAVRNANVPTLLMFLVQATGDRRWLESPYLPARTEGLGVNDSGGLAPEIQEEIRVAAAKEISAWLSGSQLAIEDPDEDLMVEMLSAAVGEAVPSEYGPLLRCERDRFSRQAHVPDAGHPAPEGFRILVIGAGMSGLIAAAYLEDAGIDYFVVDKQPEPGGSWWQNRYPGAGVDTPSHLYSFSFAKHDWRYHFELRDEIHGYMDEVARDIGATARTEFETEVVRAVHDDRTLKWRVELRKAGGRTAEVVVDAIISAVGVLNRPSLPDVNGLERFTGDVFHTAQWPVALDLTGKRVGLVGTGASAMQVGSVIADSVDRLVVFQRSPQWVAPFDLFREPLDAGSRLLLDRVPVYHSWYWLRLFWQFGDRVLTTLRIDPDWPYSDRSVNARNDHHRQQFTKYIEHKLAERPELLDHVVPDYPPFGKRILLDNGWYDMLARANVALVPRAVENVYPGGVEADGGHYDLDVLILATGFQASRFLASFEVIGRDGVRLADLWEREDGRALDGIAVPGFPNLFMLGGPNTFPGSGSFMYIVELKMQQIRRLLSKMFEVGVTAIEPQMDEYERFNHEVDAAHDQLVWTHPGMRTYYRNDAGRVVVLSPFTNLDIWRRAQNANLGAYVCLDRA